MAYLRCGPGVLLGVCFASWLIALGGPGAVKWLCFNYALAVNDTTANHQANLSKTTVMEASEPQIQLSFTSPVDVLVVCAQDRRWERFFQYACAASVLATTLVVAVMRTRFTCAHDQHLLGSLFVTAVITIMVAVIENITDVWGFWDSHKMFSEWTGVLKQLYLSAAALVAGWVLVILFNLVCQSGSAIEGVVRDMVRGKSHSKASKETAAANCGNSTTTGSNSSSSSSSDTSGAAEDMLGSSSSNGEPDGLLCMTTCPEGAVAEAAVTAQPRSASKSSPVVDGQSPHGLLTAHETKVQPYSAEATVTTAATTAAAATASGASTTAVPEGQSPLDLLADLNTDHMNQGQPYLVDATVPTVAAASAAVGALHPVEVQPEQADYVTAQVTAAAAVTAQPMLLETAAVPQATAAASDNDSHDRVSDAAVHVQVSISGGNSDRLVSKTTESIALKSYQGKDEPEDCMSRGQLDDSGLRQLSERLLLATDKAVLLGVLKELQDLATSDPTNKLCIGQSNILIESLADLLFNSDTELQGAACMLIESLAQGVPANQTKLGCCGRVISGLVKMLPGQWFQATNTLWLLAGGGDEAKSLIGSTGGKSLVYSLIGRMKEPACGVIAAGLMWMLVAGHRQNKALFAEHFTVRQLLMLIELGFKEEQEYAAGALYALIFGHEESDKVMWLARLYGVKDRVKACLREGEASTVAQESMQHIIDIFD